MAYTHDSDELRKRIIAMVIEGERAVLLDNLTGVVGNDALDMALTADRWKDRVLGSNRVYEGPLHITWFATGNNVQLGADTARRVCHVRIERPEERPELKSDFARPDLLAYVREHRGRLLGAALTILRGWHVAGRPRSLTAWGSYQGWSSVVRAAVVWAGLPDPTDTRVALQTAADRDAAAMAVVLERIRHHDPDRRGLTSAAIIKLTESDKDLETALLDLCSKLDTRKLGFRLRHLLRRVFGGWFLDVAGTRAAGQLWTVSPMSAFSKPDAESLRSHGDRTAADGDDSDGGDLSGESDFRPGDGGGTAADGDTGDGGDFSPDPDMRAIFR